MYHKNLYLLLWSSLWMIRSQTSMFILSLLSVRLYTLRLTGVHIILICMDCLLWVSLVVKPCTILCDSMHGHTCLSDAWLSSSPHRCIDSLGVKSTFSYTPLLYNRPSWPIQGVTDIRESLLHKHLLIVGVSILLSV